MCFYTILKIEKKLIAIVGAAQKALSRVLLSQASGIVGVLKASPYDSDRFIIDTTGP